MSAVLPGTIVAAPGRRTRRHVGDRLVVAALASAYFALLAYIYAFRFEQWAYLGFWYGGTDAMRLGTCYALCVVPVFMLPLRIARFSTYIHWIVYFFIYVPAVLIPVLQGLTDDVMSLAFALFASFSLIILFPSFRLPRRERRLREAVFWGWFAAAYALLFLYSAYVFRDNLTLASLLDVYGQRSTASDIAEGTLVGYTTGLLSGCFNPFLLAVGILYRRPLPALVGICGQVFVYATFALKAVVFSVLILFVFYKVLLAAPRVRIWRLGALICATILIPLSLLELTDIDSSPVLSSIVALVFMRTYGMVGALTGIYHEFFSSNPHTYFSHINIVGRFIEYPYSLSLGEVIGQYLGFDMNSNANFFASDGVAGAGFAGVVGIGLIAGFVFRAIDRAVPLRNVRLLCVASTPAAISLANTSLFTTLLTGGLLLLVVLCAVWNDGTTPDRP